MGYYDGGGGGDGDGNADGGDGANGGAPGFDRGAAGSWEQTMKPRVERFQGPFLPGRYCRSYNAFEGSEFSLYDAL